jgi:AhpD family alkylhydroperoxidase
MARIPHIELSKHPELNDAVKEITGPRSRQYPNGLEPGGHLWQLYTLLLHNAPAATAWASLINAVRTGSTLAAVDQELVILLLADINQSKFEFASHSPKAYAAGLTREQIADLGDWRNSQRFDARQRAILEYADTISRQVVVPDPVFSAVRALFSDRELIDLTLLIATYNFTMRFTVPMKLGYE